MRSLFLLLLVCLLQHLPAASAWQEAEAAGRLAEEHLQQAIGKLQSLLLDDPQLHVAHYNLGCILLDYQWRAEDDQRFGDQTRKLAKQALQLAALPDIDPLALAAEHFERASHSPVKKLAARSWHNLALARYKQGRLQDALAAAVQACDLFPDNQEFLQTRNELRRVYLEREDEARRRAEEEAKKLRLMKQPLPDAFEGRAYKAQLKARGGAGAPYQFSLLGDAQLPNALELDSSGAFSGIPGSDAVGEQQIPCMVKDSADATDSKTLPLKVWPKPTIITEHLNEAIVNQSYLAELRCEGLPRPRWLIDGLPAGLELQQQTGERVRIGGTPTETGTFQIAMTVKDETHDLIAVKSLELVVSDSFAPDTAHMPPATAWAPYRYQLRVRGPTQQYQFISQGGGGLHIDEQGNIGGSAEEAGELELPLTIQAADQRQRSFVLKMQVNPPPVIDEEEQIVLPVGQALSRQLKHEGGTAPYTWSLVDGLLPDGVRLEEYGFIAGAAAEAEEAPVTIAIEDRWGARSTKEITLQFQADDQQQQSQEQEQGQDQQQQQQDQNQQQQDQQQTADQEQQQNQQDNQQQAENQEQQQAAAESGDGEQDDAQEQQTAQIRQADIQRWLDSLPDESKRALLLQLLDGQQDSSEEEKPW